MIKVEHLTKCYGNFLAVDDLSFEIKEGHVYGFLGPNGAGKSTTMNMITGCLSATAGKITIGEHDIMEEPEIAKRLIGYLPEQPPLYLNETPKEYLQFVGEAKGLKGALLRKQIDEVIEQVGIGQVKNRLISTLSKGYKQRVGIAQALLGNPRVIILDEPTVGLDPIQIIEIRDLIKALGETHTVIFSSHILSEVQAICEEVLIIANGKLVAFDTPENLEEVLTRSNEIHLLAEAVYDEAVEILENLENVESYECRETENNTVDIIVKTDISDSKKVCCDLFFAFAEKGCPIFEMNSKKANLEDVFIELTEENAKIPEMQDEDNIGEESQKENTEESEMLEE